MLINDFYDLIDSELEFEIKNSDDNYFKKVKQPQQKKSYAFLIWFLRFYGQTLSVKEFITDGDGDSSCDIIFSKKDNYDRVMFYVVQSKWNQKNKCETKVDSNDIKYTLNDFETILRGDKKPSLNSKFNDKYKELISHLQNNGEVKFIFLSLCLANSDTEDNIYSFQKTYGPNIKIDFIDIQKIRRDYIEFRYKDLTTTSPLEYDYNPEESKIILPIERFGEKDRDFIDFNGSSRSYIFIIKPKTIYELFEKYRLSLFYKNVRNPLVTSNYNKEIKETIEKRPGLFWYFNNGITAITKLIPEIGVQAKQVELTGLQIINGAQTVYSVYLAYKEANYVQREIMDTDARITLRLIRSSDENFNFSITRFTNSQNEVKSFDFMSNDEIQVRLQNESFNTPVWYERRRGEFPEEKKPNSIHIANNVVISNAYMAFHLQNPHSALENRQLFFISRLSEPDGLYEVIFNEKTKYADMLAAYRIYSYLANSYDLGNDLDDIKLGYFKHKLGLIMNVLALTNIYLKQYLQHKYSSVDFNTSNFINKAFNFNDTEKIKIITRVISLCNKVLIIDEKFEEYDKLFQRMVVSNNYYINIAEQINEEGMTDDIISYIENFDENDSNKYLNEVAAAQFNPID